MLSSAVKLSVPFLLLFDAFCAWLLCMGRTFEELAAVDIARCDFDRNNVALLDSAH